MLVLSRRENETIEIGQAGQVLAAPIIVSVVGIGRGKVRLGIEADRSVPVHRSEIAAAIAAEQRVQPNTRR